MGTLPEKEVSLLDMANIQKLKLLALLGLLEEETDSQHGLTMPQILEKLEEAGFPAERKAIYRDFDALRASGYNVEKLPTRPVSYGLVRKGLTFDDIMVLTDIVQGSRFITERKSAQLVRGLKGLLSRRQRGLLERRVHVEGRVRSQTDSVFRNVDVIHEALRLRRQIEFLYFGYDTSLKRRPRHDGKRYRLTPVRLVFADGNYYLAAYDSASGKVKTYRVDRMELLQLSEAPAERNATIASYGADGFRYARFGMFEGRETTVTLRVAPLLMDTVMDTFGNSAILVRSAQDGAEVRVLVQVSPQFFGWLAGLEGGVVVRTPARVAEEYQAWLQRLAG